METSSTIHLIIIQFISALLNGYRLFDLNIPRDILIQQSQIKYDRTLEKLRQQINDTMVCKKSSNSRKIYQTFHRLVGSSLE